MRTFQNFLIILLIVPLFGCAGLEKAIFDKTKEPVEQVDEGTGDNLPSPSDDQQTNTADTGSVRVSTKPIVEESIRTAADFVPLPGARLFGEVLISGLTAYAGLRSRKYKKAAVSAVKAANEFKSALKEVKAEKSKSIGADLKKVQKAEGTWNTISHLIEKFTR